MPISETYNLDVMEYLSGMPDKGVGLALVDPPYGIGEDGGKSQSRRVSSSSWKTPKDSKYKHGGWDKESRHKSFFQNQIISGANHFIDKMPLPSPSWIVWDKKDGKDASDFADCELAWTSFGSSVRMFRMHWTGWGAINSGEIRQHPTQKPVALYKWILQNYARPGDKIFDPMMGSQSSRIAAYDMGFDYVGCEKDVDYFKDGEARFKKHVANKTTLFAPEQMYNFEQTKLEF